MIIKHKQMDDSNFDREIERELNNFELSGYVSMRALKTFYDMFFWVYLEKGYINNAFKDSEEAYKLSRIVSILNLSAFISKDGPAYSAVLLYQKMAQIIDMRSFDSGSVKELSSKDSNKVMDRDDFITEKMYDAYISSNLDIPKNIILSNRDIFTGISDVKKDSIIKHVSQVFNLSSVSDIVKDDFSYKLATKKLIVRTSTSEKGIDEAINRIVVIQDNTASMVKHVDKLSLIKLYILNFAISNGMVVDWHYSNNNEVDTYNMGNIHKDILLGDFRGVGMDISSVLSKNVCKDNKIIFVTDGEDSFDLDFTSGAKELSVISFTNNNGLKIGALKSGKFFKF